MKLIHIVGCRPNFIKLAPVWREAEKQGLEQFIIHTGQHYDYEMSKVFFDELEIPEPNINLHIGSFSHGKQTGLMLEKIEAGLLQEKNNAVVVVYGDTNSTLAGALAAAKLHIPVAHVEAGVRSGDMRMPEEINRVIVDCISTWRFCPQKSPQLNMNPLYWTFVGDVMYDQFLWAQNRHKYFKGDDDFVLVTIHRQENTEPKRFQEIENAISNLRSFTPMSIFWPRHPRTPDPSPMSYLQMLPAIRAAKLVITDSGGIQKEALWSRTPCVTLRDTTEWPETVQLGWNVLLQPEELNTYEFDKLGKIPYNENPYGDGKAAERIVNILKEVGNG